MKFWGKADRVVAYKNKSAADARKKEVMDKHLTFLVGQTQRYSSLLAERLHTGKFVPNNVSFFYQVLCCVVLCCVVLCCVVLCCVVLCCVVLCCVVLCCVQSVNSVLCHV
jgi:hypothetical protein